MELQKSLYRRANWSTLRKSGYKRTSERPTTVQKMNKNWKNFHGKFSTIGDVFVTCASTRQHCHLRLVAREKRKAGCQIPAIWRSCSTYLRGRILNIVSRTSVQFMPNTQISYQPCWYCLGNSRSGGAQWSNADSDVHQTHVTILLEEFVKDLKIPWL